MKTKEDVIRALKQAHFIERTADLAVKYRRNPDAKRLPVPNKKKVLDILDKLGYEAKTASGFYCFSKKGTKNEEFKIRLHFFYSWLQFVFYYGSIYSGCWFEIKADIMNDENYRSGSPAYSNYEELEEILAEAIKIYEDSVKALFGL